MCIGFHRLGPYHVARLRAAARCVEVLAIERCSKDSVYDWEEVEARDLEFERVTLAPRESMTVAEARRAHRRLESSLERYRPQAVAIPGWSNRLSHWLLDWAGDHGVPIIIMSESQRTDAQRGWLKETGKKLLVKQCSAALVGGATHREYLKRLGMEPSSIFLGYDAVDNRHFASGADAARLNETPLRSALGLPASYFLASARFVAKKNLGGLLRAYARYRMLAESPWSLVVLGDGPLRGELESFIGSNDLGHAVQLMGFRQYDELPRFYGLAKAFVHASTVEQWGLVVNEAMAAGLPVLVSSRCGCAPDLVAGGSNGFTFDPDDIDGLAGLLLRISSEDCDRAAMSASSRRIVEDWGPERFAEGLAAAVSAAERRTVRGSGLAGRLLVKALA